MLLSGLPVEILQLQVESGSKKIHPVWLVNLSRVKMDALSGKCYLTEFKCKEYLSLLYPSVKRGNPNEETIIDFHRKQVYSFYAKYNSNWNNKTARLLEFGGGPVIANLISAVPYVNQIIFSAYAESE